MRKVLLTFDSDQIETNGQLHSVSLIRLSYQILNPESRRSRDRKLGHFIGFGSHEALEWVIHDESSWVVRHMTSFVLLIRLSHILINYDSQWRHNRQKSSLPVNQLAISRVTGSFRNYKTGIRYQRDKTFLTSYYSTKSVKVVFFTKFTRMWLFMVLFDRKKSNFRYLDTTFLGLRNAITGFRGREKRCRYPFFSIYYR